MKQIKSQSVRLSPNAPVLSPILLMVVSHQDGGGQGVEFAGWASVKSTRHFFGRRTRCILRFMFALLLGFFASFAANADIPAVAYLGSTNLNIKMGQSPCGVVDYQTTPYHGSIGVTSTDKYCVAHDVNEIYYDFGWSIVRSVDPPIWPGISFACPESYYVCKTGALDFPIGSVWVGCPDVNSTLNKGKFSCTCNDGYADHPLTGASCVPVVETNQAQTPQACRAESAAGNPIYPLMGIKKEFVHTGVELDRNELILTYTTVSKAPGPQPTMPTVLVELPSFGELWRSSFHRRLQISPGLRSALLARGDGAVVNFSGDGAGVFTAGAGNPNALTAVTGGYLFTDAATGNLESYDASGKLLRITSNRGVTLTFTYTGGNQLAKVSTPEGRAVSFIYVNGLIARIIMPDGNSIIPEYDQSLRLVAMTMPDGRVKRFLYENPLFPWALTGRIDENNSRFATYSYDAFGRAIATEHAGSVDRFAVEYAVAPARTVTETFDSTNNILYRIHGWQLPSGTTLTTPGGQAVNIDAVSVLGMPSIQKQSQPAGSGCSASNSGLSYDGAGNVSVRDDFAGNRACYVYDNGNRETVRVEGLASTVDCPTVISAGATLPAGARKTTTAWHSDWRLPIKIAQPGLLKSVVYHGQPDPFNGGAVASCTLAASLPNGKPTPMVCKEVQQATLDAGGAASGTVDPSYDAVSLLLHADGVNGSRSFVDSSSSPKTATVSGNASISTAQSKFGGASAYFDGASSSYIYYPASGTIVSSGDITIEGWVYPTATSQGTIYSNFTGSSAGHSLLYYANSQLIWYYSGNSSFYTPANSVPANQWSHFALVRAGSTCTIFVNGAALASTSCNSAIGTTATDLRIGNAQWSSIPFKGYLDEFRITRGTARYAANFTPSSIAFGGSIVDPSMPARIFNYTYDAAGRLLTSVDPDGRVTSRAFYVDTAFSGSSTDDPYYGSVSLLLHGNGANGATTFVDNSPTPKSVVAAGSATISTTQSRFGGSSIYLSGAGDYATIAPHADFSLGTGDFTMEAWVYLDGNSSASSGDGLRAADIFSNYTDTNLQGTFAFYINGSTATTGTGFGLSVFDAGVYKSTVWAGAISQNAWHHFAVARTGGVVSLYLDGGKVTATDGVGSSSLTASSRTLAIGRALHPSYPRNLKGYIDDLRITKGVGRYTTSFTLPTAEFPNNGPIPSPTDIGHAVGDLQSVTNAAGHVTQFTQYDRAGRVRQTIDPKGVVTDITYTPRGWVSTVTTTAPGGSPRLTSYSYDGVGQLTGVTQPDGSTLSYSYDAAHRLVGVNDAKGNSVNYTLDNVGNRIAEDIKDPTGVLQRSISRSFDALNRLQQVTGAAY